MKFVCLAYLNLHEWSGKSEAYKLQFEEDCFAYEDELRAQGHFVDAESLEAGGGLRLQIENGRSVTREVSVERPIAYILKIEARDLNHAITLVADHPRVSAGAFSIFSSDVRLNALRSARELKHSLQLKSRIRAFSATHGASTRPGTRKGNER